MIASFVIRAPLVCLALLMAFQVGCGRGPRVMKVAGVVTLDGKPLEGAVITFRSVEQGPERIADSTAMIDASGKYELLLGDGSQLGGVPGNHYVTILNGAGATPLLDDFGRTIASPLPELYRNGTLIFYVPEEGALAADFHILSERRPPGR